MCRTLSCQLLTPSLEQDASFPASSALYTEENEEGLLDG